jgi:SAM-dependent methyltransferase
VPGTSPQADFLAVIARYRLAAEYLRRGQVSKVLDVGCGTGVGSGFLAHEGFEVVGIEPSPEAVAFGNAANFHPRLRLVVGVGEHLAQAAESIDAVLAFESLEHMDAPHEFLNEAWRVLKPGGWFACSVPHCLADVINEVASDTNPFHVQRFTPHSMRHLLGRRYRVEEEYAQHVEHLSAYLGRVAKTWSYQQIAAMPVLGGLLRARSLRRAASNTGDDGTTHPRVDYAQWGTQALPQVAQPLRCDPGAPRFLVPRTLIFICRKS